MLENALQYPLIAVCAGSGYGKTRAVYSFLQKYDAQTIWIQLSERDNVATRFMENYARMISSVWPEFGARLLEIGFPETDEAFAEYIALRAQALTPPKKYILVYDDFHLIKNPAVLRFFEKTVSTMPSNAKRILISRTMPEIDIIGMMLQERLFTVREDDLCFTEEETNEYFSRRLALSITRQDVKDIYDDTRGWAFAVNLIGRSLRRDTPYKRYALEAMKANIYKFIELEICQIISEKLWYFLLRISLIDHLAAGLIRILANDSTLIKEVELLNAYMRYDFYLDAYIIHHLFLDYLCRHQHLLNEEEKCDTYNKAGTWCEHNHYQADALSYYEKAMNYDALLRIMNTLNSGTPQDINKYALGIIESLPEEKIQKYPSFLVIKTKLLICLGDILKSAELTETYIGKYEQYPETTEIRYILAGFYEIRNRQLYGFDDLVEAEDLFLRMELGVAEKYANQALSKSLERGIFDIQSRAMCILMNIYLLHGNYKAANKMLTDVKEILKNSENRIYYKICDIISSFYCLIMGQPQLAAESMKSAFEIFPNYTFWEVYSNHIRTQYHFYSRNYNPLLAFLENEGGRQEIPLLKIDAKILKALALYRLKRRSEALEALHDAYKTAQPYGYITPFVRHAKYMRTITAAALKQKEYPVPKVWLTIINRKASAFAKRQVNMASEYKNQNLIGDRPSLTGRELDILKDLSHGLSRTEIAASRDISINTVKMVVNIIFEKLCANNLADAVRIAAERNII